MMYSGLKRNRKPRLSGLAYFFWWPSRRRRTEKGTATVREVHGLAVGTQQGASLPGASVNSWMQLGTCSGKANHSLTRDPPRNFLHVAANRDRCWRAVGVLERR